MDALTPIMPISTSKTAVPTISTTKETPIGLSTKEKKAFQDFEKMFVHMMLKEMRKTMNGSSMTEKSHATKMYEEMMDEAMAEQMASSNQLGIGSGLANELEAERLRQNLQVVESSLLTNSLEDIKV